MKVNCRRTRVFDAIGEDVDFVLTREALGQFDSVATVPALSVEVVDDECDFHDSVLRHESVRGDSNARFRR